VVQPISPASCHVQVSSKSTSFPTLTTSCSLLLVRLLVVVVLLLLLLLLLYSR
jgi:hypothetical protein